MMDSPELIILDVGHGKVIALFFVIQTLLLLLIVLHPQH